MQSARSRFSHRHLLALGTFLVPLAIFGGLVWSELQRSGASAQTALLGESRSFVKSARDAIEQRFKDVLPGLMRQSLGIDELTPARLIQVTQQLKEQPRFKALRAILVLSEPLNVLVPPLPSQPANLPLLDPPSGSETDQELHMAELASHAGESEYPIASAWLQHLLQTLEDATPAGEYARPGLAEREVIARLDHAILLRKMPNCEAEARRQLELVGKLMAPRGPRQLRLDPTTRFMAEYLRADLGTPEDRLGLLRAITDNRYDAPPDGLLTAIAQRLAARFPEGDPARQEVDALLDREDCRVAIREFAADFDYIKIALRRNRQTNPSDDPDETERLTWRSGDRFVLVCVRPATATENATRNAASIAFALDLDTLVGDVLERFVSREGRFVLAVHDMFDNPIVPPPPAPPDFVVPTETANDLTLTGYPTDPAQFVANAEASANQRTLAIVVLFVMALGGALWSWRSVSRETELAAMKVDLVSRVSHELKTPLALVRMYGETLGMGRARDNAQVAEFGGIIAREAERLTALIQRILDFSRQQAGTLSYAAAPIDLTALLREVVEAYGPHLLARGAVLVDTLPHGIRVHCDPNACESAVVNLLENAAKYGIEGDDEHEIELELARRDDSAVIEVRDRGRGIPPAELARVFDGFYRASNAGEVRGAGLGLSLVRHFARAHGGEVEALPRDGGGTVMRLTLPLAPAPAAAPPPLEPPLDAAPRPATDS